MDGTASPFPVTLNKSGGIAGVNRTVTVDEQGNWSAASQRGVPSPQAGRLTEDDRLRLLRLLSDARLRGEIDDAKPDQRCADAFRYDLTVAANHYIFEDCHGLGELLTELLTMMREKAAL